MTARTLACRFLKRVLFSTWIVASLTARVGEPTAVIEGRILKPNVGTFYSRPKDNDNGSERENREAERERAKELKEQPFNEAKKFFPPDTREVIYWKSAVAKTISQTNGWKMHVFYVGGRSALEAYNRVGDSLSEFEVAYLLATHRGGSTWRKITSEGGTVNGIGYDYELEDGSMRAKQKGNWLMIFSGRLDAYVIAQQIAAKETADRAELVNRISQEKKAPESVLGF